MLLLAMSLPDGATGFGPRAAGTGRKGTLRLRERTFCGDYAVERLPPADPADPAGASGAAETWRVQHLDGADGGRSWTAEVGAGGVQVGGTFAPEHLAAVCFLWLRQRELHGAGAAPAPVRGASGEDLWESHLREVMEGCGEFERYESGVDAGAVEVCSTSGSVLLLCGRKVAVRMKLLLRGAGLVVMAPGQWLVHRRSLNRKLFGGYWDMFLGGLCDPGEAASTTAARELSEEMGIAAAGDSPPVHLFTCVVRTGKNQVHVTMFAAAVAAEQARDFASGARWDPEEVDTAFFAPFPEVLRAAREARGRSAEACRWEALPAASSPPAGAAAAAVIREIARDVEAADAEPLGGEDPRRFPEDAVFVPDGMAVWDALLQKLGGEAA